MVANALGYQHRHRHPRHPEPGEEGHAAPARRRAGRGAGRPLQNPNNYVKYSGRLAEALAKTEPNGAIWANQFDNVANRAGPYRDDRRRRSGQQTDGKVDGFICAVGSGGTLAASATASRPRARISGSRWPIRWAPRSTASTPRASLRPKAPRSPKASARAASPRISKARGRSTPTRSPTRKRCRSSSTC